jgi:hypothetical protein
MLVLTINENKKPDSDILLHRDNKINRSAFQIQILKKLETIGLMILIIIIVCYLNVIYNFKYELNVIR